MIDLIRAGTSDKKKSRHYTQKRLTHLPLSSFPSDIYCACAPARSSAALFAFSFAI